MCILVMMFLRLSAQLYIHKNLLQVCITQSGPASFILSMRLFASGYLAHEFDFIIAEGDVVADCPYDLSCPVESP